MAPQRIIIDTDPGIDDILAMLLAFSCKPELVEVVLVSVTYGNVEVHDCLRNVASLFHIIAKEQEWRRSQSRPDGFDTLKTFRPTVAVGAEEPLGDQLMMADFFHGKDGLGGVHASHPHLSPTDTWRTLFDLPTEPSSPSETLKSADVKLSTEEHASFTPSKLTAPKEILRTLKENPQDTITIVAIGPMTNLALAAAEDPETFLRVKEVVVMGGAINEPGNRPGSLSKSLSLFRQKLMNSPQITPTAEFNFCADAFAAARVLALTSSNPSTTMPPTPPKPPPGTASSQQVDTESESPPPPFLRPYPDDLSRRLNLTLLPLDITTRHLLTPSTFHTYVDEPLRAGSPLAEWTNAFLGPTFRKATEIVQGLSLHDPLAVWYAMQRHASTSASGDAKWDVRKEQDIRIETTGQWTRGACITDKRGRSKRKETEDPELHKPVSGDAGGWLSERRGNRVSVLTRTPVEEGAFGRVLCEQIFGKVE